MQNRRILDMHFREAGAEIHASLETNSLLTLWSHLRSGHWSTVVPHTFLLLGADCRIEAIPLVEPEASHLIGLVASDRDPLPPVAQAVLDLARGLDIGKPIDRHIGQPALPVWLDLPDALLIETVDQLINNFRLIGRCPPRDLPQRAGNW